MILIPNIVRGIPTGTATGFEFNHRIKDAVESVRKGYGDYITLLHYDTGKLGVVRYVDRVYGESIRAQVIANYMDEQFGYNLMIESASDELPNQFVAKDNLDTYLKLRSSTTEEDRFKLAEFNSKCIEKDNLLGYLLCHELNRIKYKIRITQGVSKTQSVSLSI